ncbi:endonuclease/exonuclease/phosphatase family protein [Pseudalkalibacillus sp. SCS-8]|uniref:endonuclease/exonuclease/phosphatase family protein n=1 Tax=Pseudalkalibacillus nanhaiensis TaxID=3115291 RepID=UPI0032DB36F5
MELKAMTFNLRVDLPQDGKNAWAHRKDKVKHMLGKHRPLIIGTQEGTLPMLKDISHLLPDYQWLGEGRRGGLEDEFCAIFYRGEELEVLNSGQFWLSEQPDVPGSISWDSDFPRICTWAYFQSKIHRQESFLHFNTHLDHVSQQAREKGIQLILEKIQQLHAKEGVPVILTGDFNAEPDQKAIRYIDEYVSDTLTLQDAFSQITPGKTFHSFEGGFKGKPIDYIFTTPDVHILSTEIDRSEVNGGYPSDHYPVLTTLQIPSKEA